MVSLEQRISDCADRRNYEDKEKKTGKPGKQVL